MDSSESIITTVEATAKRAPVYKPQKFLNLMNMSLFTGLFSVKTYVIFTISFKKDIFSSNNSEFCQHWPPNTQDQ
jgi:hypothetical protein